LQRLILCAARLDALGYMGDAYHKSLLEYILVSINRILAQASQQPLDIEVLPESRGDSSERKQFVEFLKSLNQNDFIDLLKEISHFGNELITRFERTMRFMLSVLEKNQEPLKNAGVVMDSKLIEALTKQFQDICGFTTEHILGKILDLITVRPCVSS
jgi:hypothetical protein